MTKQQRQKKIKRLEEILQKRSITKRNKVSNAKLNGLSVNNTKRNYELLSIFYIYARKIRVWRGSKLKMTELYKRRPKRCKTN